MVNSLSVSNSVLSHYMAGATLSTEKIANAKKYFDDVLTRLKYVAHVRFDYQVAALLGFGRDKFATRKLRSQVPKTEIELWATKNGISFKWLMTGEGEPFLPESEQPSQPTIQTLVRASFEDMPSLTFPRPILSGDDIEYSMKRARRVLESKLHLYASALYVNIASFYRATLAEEEKLDAPSREPPTAEDAIDHTVRRDPPLAGPPPAGISKGMETSLNGGLDSEAKKKIKEILEDDDHLVIVV